MASNYLRGQLDLSEIHPAAETDFWGEPIRPNSTRLSTDEKTKRTAEAFHKIVGFAMIMTPPTILDLGIDDSQRLRELLDYIKRLDDGLGLL